MDDIDSIIVRLCLLLGWTFEYACKFVKETPLKKLRAFIVELQYQKAIEDYRVASYSASIIATMASNKQHKYKVSEIIGKPPQRENAKTQLTKAAEGANIKLPLGGIK